MTDRPLAGFGIVVAGGSRGIGAAEARDLLTFAFATDVINRVHVGALREKLDALLHTRLRQGRVNLET